MYDPKEDDIREKKFLYEKEEVRMKKLVEERQKARE